ncbi:CooT family nickel-binding protein [Carboxydothermus pertinax]
MIIEPFKDGMHLVDIFSKQKSVKAKVRNMNLLSHWIF